MELERMKRRMWKECRDAIILFGLTHPLSQLPTPCAFFPRRFFLCVSVCVLRQSILTHQWDSLRKLQVLFRGMICLMWHKAGEVSEYAGSAWGLCVNAGILQKDNERSMIKLLLLCWQHTFSAITMVTVNIVAKSQSLLLCLILAKEKKKSNQYNESFAQKQSLLCHPILHLVLNYNSHTHIRISDR